MPQDRQDDERQVRVKPHDSEQVIYRSHGTGARITRAEWETERDKYGRHKRQQRKDDRPPSKRERIPESELEWGGGLKQKRDLESEQTRETEIMKGPFAAFDIEDSLDKELRQQSRWDDPLERMKEMEAKRHRKKHKHHDPASKDEIEKSPTPKASKKCLFPGPPNRYGIAPGSKWDGKIRGNGFEERYLVARSEKVATMRSHIGTDIKTRF